MSAADQDTLCLSEQDFRLDEVEVVARQQRTILPPQRLEGAQLQALSTTSVADAVRYFSGVQLKDYGGVGGMKTVDVRSMGSHHLGVFYDGIEIGNAQNGTVDLGKFSMDNLEAIELYNGQKADIFQSAKDFGSAGTLYLRTRRPHFAPDKPYNIEVRMRAGTFGLANPSVLYEQRLTDKIHLSANAEYTYATGRYHFRNRALYPDGSTAWDTTAVRQNGEVNAYRAELGLFGYTDYSKWHVKGYLYGSSRGIPCAIVRNVWGNAQHQWDRNAFVQGNYTTQIPLPLDGERGRGKGLDLMLSAKYANDHLRYLDPDSTRRIIDNTFLQQEVYLSAAAKYAIFPIWDVSAALDYQLGWLGSNMASFTSPLRHTVMAAVATAVSYKWVKAQASLLETHVRDVLRTEPETPLSYMPKAGRYNALTPAAFLNIKPYLPEEFYIRAFYKDVFRMPTFNDLYYAEVVATNLKPERARQFDLGAEYTYSTSPCPLTEKGVGGKGLSLNLRADGYFNRVDNKIIAVPKGNSQYRWSMQNLGKVDILGTELSADLNIGLCNNPSPSLGGRGVNLHFSYTFQRALDKSDPLDNDPVYGTYNHQIAYIPRHSCSAMASFSWDGLNIMYSFVYVGSRYSASANTIYNYLQPWYTHDLSASYRWNLKKMALQVGVEVNNIFNQQYEVIPNYPMPGINGKGIVKIEI